MFKRDPCCMANNIYSQTDRLVYYLARVFPDRKGMHDYVKPSKFLNQLFI